jgi:hypothetical protein
LNFSKNQTEFDSVDIDKKLVFTLNKYYKKYKFTLLFW